MLLQRTDGNGEKQHFLETINSKTTKSSNRIR